MLGNGIKNFKNLIKFSNLSNFNFSRKILDRNNIPSSKDDIPIRISPYFSKAVKEKDKNANNLNVSDLDSKDSKKESKDIQEKQSKERINKIKQKLVYTNKNKKGKKIGLMMDNIKRELPNEYFRMGLNEEDMREHHPLVKRAMSLDNASISEFRKARMLEIRKIFGTHERDTATPPITACALCENVLSLLSHIRKNKGDMTAFIKLQKFLTKRRKYLLYLKRTDFNSYSYVIKYYGLKDFEDHMHKKFKKCVNFPRIPEDSNPRVVPDRLNG